MPGGGVAGAAAGVVVAAGAAAESQAQSLSPPMGFKILTSTLDLAANSLYNAFLLSPCIFGLFIAVALSLRLLDAAYHFVGKKPEDASLGMLWLVGMLGSTGYVAPVVYFGGIANMFDSAMVAALVAAGVMGYWIFAAAGIFGAFCLGVMVWDCVTVRQIRL